MRRRLLTVVPLLLLLALPARSEQITLSTEMVYQLVDQRFRDPEQRTTTSGFRPRLNLSLTGPVRPGSDLYLDVTGGLTRNTFGITRQSAADVHLVLRGEDPRYHLSLRRSISRFSSSTDSLDLGPSQFSSDSQETGVTLILREPAWPVLNLQYSRFASDSGLGGAGSRTESTDSRVTALYAAAPLRFRFDGNRRATGSAGSDTTESTARRFGVSLDAALLPKLGLFGDVQFSRSDVRLGSEFLAGSNSRVVQVRCSTELTPKAAVDAELRSLMTDTRTGSARNDLAVRGSSVTMRSEVLPGLQFNLSRNANRSERGGVTADVSSINGDLLAQLDANNSLVVSSSPSRVDVAGLPSERLGAQRMSWISRLNSQADLTVNLDRFKTSSTTSGSHSTNRYVALRYHPDLQTTIGVGLLWGRSSSFGPDSRTSQDSRTLQTEFSWLPTSTIGLGLHLSVSRLSGVSEARVAIPALDFRWQPDSSSNFALNWRLQSQQQRELADFSRRDLTTVSARFSRRLSRNSVLNLAYDVLKFSQGPFAYERRLSMSITGGAGS